MQDAINRINTFKPADWQELLSLIPEIESTTVFATDHPMQQDENGDYIITPTINGPLINRFLKIAYNMPIIISFDWAAWDEGRKMASDEHFDFNTVDIPTKCKLITALVRNDRFCDGVLAGAFKSGLIMKLLKSIRHQLQNPNR